MKTNSNLIILFIGLAIIAISCQNKPAMPTPLVKTHAFRLKPGQDLRKEIESYVKAHNIEAGWIVTCVGSLTQYNLRFANQPEGSKGNGHFEIVSLVGTLSTHGSHLHASVSDSLGRTVGGHLLEGNLVYTTAEIVLGESTDMIFKRVKDGSTEWPELEVGKR